jgi:hypothetical protein
MYRPFYGGGAARLEAHPLVTFTRAGLTVGDFQVLRAFRLR